ncbi:Hypothetical protein PFCIRM134_07395 [Propionibacterium freudenreichii]|uniref:DUF554 domain-containing protein n=1 Tax=Propionibacterium freudenreichii TaxID=1744 RepID=UPI000541BC20|nr:DUF554 domain-containing protein [Propionibacterium freudenreichii]CEH04574.1 Hypothetical protein PFCIRM134_07395 [Propionibacterium freudenreichii]
MHRRGAAVGTLFGEHLPSRVRDAVTPVLGLVVVTIGGLSIPSLLDASVPRAVGQAGVVIVLLALVIGTMLGAWWRLEQRIEQLGEWARSTFNRGRPAGTTLTSRSVEGFVTATLVFCIGPMGILGSLQDGLGQGNDQLIVKAILDGFTALALSASFGFAVAGGAAVVLVYQGLLTVLGWWLGGLLPPAELNVLDATGGIILMALGLRLAGIARLAVAEMVPALVLAPVGVVIVGLVT